jgi:hypothetical protein
VISQSNRLHKIAFPATDQAALSRRIALVRHAFVATMLEPQSSSDRVLPADERQRKPTTPDHIVSLSRRLLDEVKDLRGQAAATAAAPSEISESARPSWRTPPQSVGQGAFSLHHDDAGDTIGLPDMPVVRPPARLRPKPSRRPQRPSARTVGFYMCPACAPSSIVSAPANSVALTQCRNGQTQKRSNARVPALSGSVDNCDRNVLPPSATGRCRPRP